MCQTISFARSRVKTFRNVEIVWQVISSVQTENIHTNINICKVVIPVCLSVCMSDHNSRTPGPICLKLRLRNSLEPREYS